VKVQKGSVEIEAFSLDEAKALAASSIPEYARITTIKLVDEPRKGILGIGKRAGRYRIYFRIAPSQQQTAQAKDKKTARAWTSSAKGKKDRKTRKEESRRAEVEAATAKLRKICELPTEGLSYKEIYFRTGRPIEKLGEKLSRLGGTGLMRRALAGLPPKYRELVSYAWDGRGGWKHPSKKKLQRQLTEELLRQAARLEEVSGKCDICNQPASTAKGGKVFTAEEMQGATKRGFNAYASGDPARMMALGGFGKDEVSALWKQDVMRDNTDWLLCPRCQSKIRRYL